MVWVSTSRQSSVQVLFSFSKCKDLPTAFHTIFGTTLFLFGNIIAQDPSLALPGEPSNSTPYWLTAIDTFQTGENLPIRVSGRGCQSAPEDWRMAVVWGRILVHLADEVLTRQRTTPNSTPMSNPLLPGLSGFPFMFSAPINTIDEPNWPRDSPFALIAARRPPSSYRISLNNVTCYELLQLAQDQFSRGIFHMPHLRNQMAPVVASGSRSVLSAKDAFSPGDGSSSTTTTAQPSLTIGSFSRTKELYTIGSDVMLLAEKLDSPSERYHWANWADGIFSQMKMETNHAELSWRIQVATARGRCSLVMGSARAEEMDSELEKGELDVLKTPEAEEARSALRNAIVFLEKARELLGSDGDNDASRNNIVSAVSNVSPSLKASMAVEGGVDEEEIIEDESGNNMAAEGVVLVDSLDDESSEQTELRKLLAEALLTLANLTVNEAGREALYARAYKEGRGAFELDDAEDRMDESA